MLVMALRCVAQTDTTVFAALPDGTPLSATSIDFKRPCFDFSVSQDNRVVSVRLRDQTEKRKWLDTGLDCLYDLNKGAVLWAQPKDFPYQGENYYDTSFQLSNHYLSGINQESVYMTSHGALIRDKGDMKLLDVSTPFHDTKWADGMYVVLVNDSLDVLLAYSSPTGQKLKGYQLSTGKLLWQQKVPHKYNWGWDNVTVINPTTLLLAADDINIINVKTGNVIRYNAKTGYVDVGAVVLQGLTMMAGAVFGGMLSAALYNGFSSTYFYYTPNVGNNIVSAVTSGGVKVGSNYYVTDRDSMFCFNGYGNLAWSKPFPHKTMGAAEIYGEGNSLYVINRGYGLKGGMTMKKIGHPFIASLNPNTGETNYIKYLSEGREVIKGSSFTGGAGFIIMDDSLAYNVLGDTTVIRREWDEDADGKLVFMATDTIYTFRMNDTNLTPLYPTRDRCVVVTEKGKSKMKQRLMKVVDNDLRITDDYSADNVYLVEGTYKGYAIVAPDSEDKENDYWLIRKSGVPVAHITIPVQKLKISGDTLFILSGTKLIQVDLTRLLQG